MASIPYREQVQRLREDAIVGAVNRLLVTKGYELMTVDEVAAEAGLSKASLYKHFTSKEELAAAAMIRLLERAIAQIAEQQRRSPQASALAQVETLVRWTLKVQLDGVTPARVRYTGVSIAFNVGGIIGGGLAPIVAQALADAGGLWLVGLYLASAGAVSFAALAMLRRPALP